MMTMMTIIIAVNAVLYVNNVHSLNDRSAAGWSKFISQCYFNCRINWTLTTRLQLQERQFCVVYCINTPIDYMLALYVFLCISVWLYWWCTDWLGRRTCDQEVASSTPGCYAAR